MPQMQGTHRLGQPKPAHSHTCFSWKPPKANSLLLRQSVHAGAGPHESSSGENARAAERRVGAAAPLAAGAGAPAVSPAAPSAPGASAGCAGAQYTRHAASAGAALASATAGCASDCSMRICRESGLSQQISSKAS